MFQGQTLDILIYLLNLLFFIFYLLLELQLCIEQLVV